MMGSAKPLGRKRVFVCSPLRPSPGQTLQQNVELAKRLCRAAIQADAAPFAPHVFYPALGLDDLNPQDREAGMACGTRWLDVADELWVYGEEYDQCSDGMKQEIDRALTRTVQVAVRYMPAPFRGVEP